MAAVRIVVGVHVSGVVMVAGLLIVGMAGHDLSHESGKGDVIGYSVIPRPSRADPCIAGASSGEAGAQRSVTGMSRTNEESGVW